MAAHPFGPIETFLLRGSIKLGFDPRKVRPIFHDIKKVKQVDVVNISKWAFFPPNLPNYELERTAIVNSSDYEGGFIESLHDLDLLSRGLGYRITFTMPADRVYHSNNLDS